MNLAPFVEESISSTPARTFGWLATIPIVFPFSLAKPVTRFAANNSDISKKLFLSTRRF